MCISQVATMKFMCLCANHHPLGFRSCASSMSSRAGAPAETAAPLPMVSTNCPRARAKARLDVTMNAGELS